jgi:Alcohol dehydrogenase transcription factor Myb/SANT-like
MAKIKLSEIQKSELIDLVKVRPALFNTSLEEYHDIKLKDSLWVDVGKELTDIELSGKCLNCFKSISKKIFHIHCCRNTGQR